MHTGSVDDLLHTRYGTSARGENEEDIDDLNPTADPDETATKEHSLPTDDSRSFYC